MPGDSTALLEGSDRATTASLWAPVALRGRDIVRGNPVLRHVGLWMLQRSPGLRAFVLQKLLTRSSATYRDWLDRHDTLTDSDRAAIAARIASLPPRLISVVMPVYNPRERWLTAAIASVHAQLYPHWELCIADDASTAPHVARVLAEAARDRRVKIVRRAENGHISEATNSALALAGGEFVALMDHDDLLPPHALYMVAEELAAHPETDLIYTDEDQIDARGRRFQPHFKTDWDPDLALGQNMVSHLGIYRRSLLAALGGLRSGFDGSQDHELVLRVAEATTAERIRHIPAVLYHWRQTGQGSFSEGAPQRCAAASRRAVAGHLARTDGSDASVEPNPLVPLWARVVRRLPEPAPLVTAIVHTRDRADLLARCAAGLLDNAGYPALELLVVDAGSVETATHDLLARLAADPRVRVLPGGHADNPAAAINRAAAAANGEVLLLLDRDIDTAKPGWLDEMVAQALRPEVGAVGAKLLHADGRVQHGGYVLGVGPDGIAGSYEPLAARQAPGYAGRLQLLREVSAVSGACLAVRRAVFDEVGGLDSGHLPTRFTDVDFCLRLRQRGYRVVWTPFAELHRSDPQAPEAGDRPEPAGLQREAAHMRARWGAMLEADPFYSPNFSRRSGDYQLAAPRRRRPWQVVGDALA